jgi:hypothetical protein
MAPGTHQPSSSRPRRLLVAGALLVATGVAAVMTSLPRAAFLAHTAPDDAYYYLEIARQAGERAWPSFDGVHTTTGFHPLWLFVLTPVAKVIASTWAFARAAVALSLALMLGASLLMGRVTARAFGSTAGALAATILLASAGTLRFGLMAMEGPLELVLLALFLGEQVLGRARPLVAGALAGLTILARIDAAIPIAVALALPLYQGRSWRDFGRAAMAAVGASAFVGPYVVWNFLLTGHVITISSATKAYVATLPREGGLLTDLSRVAGELVRISPASVLAGPIAVVGGDYPSVVRAADHPLAIATLAVATAVVAAFLGRPLVHEDELPHERYFQGGRNLLRVLVGSSFIHVALSCVMLTGQSGPWYWGVEAVTAAVVTAAAYARWKACRRAAGALAIACVLTSPMILLGLASAQARGALSARRSFGSEMVVSAEQIAREDEAIGSCNAGTLGYYHGGHVVNLDGLVNDWSLLAARKAGPSAIRAWMAHAGIRSIADCVPAGKIDAYARSLGLRAADITVIDERDTASCRAFVWRIEGPARGPKMGVEAQR